MILITSDKIIARVNTIILLANAYYYNNNHNKVDNNSIAQLTSLSQICHL